jgi:uncharacterized protein (TIGR03083 family)
MSREDILKNLDAEFDALLQSVEGLTDDRMKQVWFGEWGVRDILAHVAGWHREMTGAFERIARGERPVPEGVDYSNADPINARFAEAQRSADANGIIAELKASKDAFVSAARQLPEDRFEEGKTAYRILHTTGIDHYQEHEPAIREWRRREGI